MLREGCRCPTLANTPAAAGAAALIAPDCPIHTNTPDGGVGVDPVGGGYGPGVAELAARQRRMLTAVRARGVRDVRVVAAMSEVARERFVPAELAEHAYEPSPLAIGSGQTISEPAVVAVMTAALGLTGTERVLEVGTGSGYAAAVLSRCARHVLSIEYHDHLARGARTALAAAGYDNVEVRTGDGSAGAPDRAPFDAISVTAMAQDQLPTGLVDQLTGDGVLVCPVGHGGQGHLLRTQHGHTEALLPVGFVPLISHS